MTFGDHPVPADGAPVAADPRVVAVVVTHDRRDLLAACLDALLAQQRPATQVLVIDNASTDGSADLASAHRAAPTVVRLRRNVGGAGGFAFGIRYAVDVLGADRLWLMDDDTLPAPGALGALLAAVDRYPGAVDIASSRVRWTDGRDHPMNTPRRHPWPGRRAAAAAAAAGVVPIRSASFVSMLLSAHAVRRVGLPIADYFLWNDDFEYSCRVLRHGTGVLVPDSTVEHHTAGSGSWSDPGDRFYYEVRNKVWMFTRSAALRPVERVVYGGSTLRRWALTVLNASHTRVVLRAAGRGLRDAVLEGPRDTEALLVGLVADDQPGGAGPGYHARAAVG